MLTQTGRLLVAGSALFGALTVVAQRPRGGGEEGRDGERILRIRRLPKMGRGVLVRTPEYNATGASSPRDPREWAHFEVEFEAYPDWIDEVVFTYYVVTQTDARTRPENQPEFSFYQTSVRYTDVSSGTRKLSSVFLRPAAVARYGPPVALAVEVTYEGNVVAMDGAASMTLPENWWRDPNILQSDNLVRREGYLVPRSQTPFALLNWDDYEVAR